LLPDLLGMAVVLRTPSRVTSIPLSSFTFAAPISWSGVYQIVPNVVEADLSELKAVVVRTTQFLATHVLVIMIMTWMIRMGFQVATFRLVD